VQQTVARFGRLDVLVNCAASWKSTRLEDVTAAEVATISTPTRWGPFFCSQQAGLAMVKQPEGGNIINIGDWATVRPYLHYAAYFPSKGALPTMTRTFALELASRNPNVRVNCILPGPVMLPPN